MSTKKTTVFYAILISLASIAMGMVIASRLDLTPRSMAGSLTIPAANSAPLTGSIDASTFRTIAQSESPTVVRIMTDGTAKHSAQDMPPQLRQFFNAPMPEEEVPVEGLGSGFIIDKSGLILTNNHVVDGATAIHVMLMGSVPGDQGLTAKVVGRDRLTDSALIQLTQMPGTPLPEAKWGDSDAMAPGDWVMAIGNPFGYDHSVSVGVVSAVGRVAPELQPVDKRDLPMIQTDAAINKGNSGGPLLNIRGEVIGINTAIISDSGGNVGIGFAVPINTIRKVLPSLKTGKVVRGRIGVTIQPLTTLTVDDRKQLGLSATAGGAMIVSVDPNGPSAKVLKPLDVVTAYNGQPVKDNTDLVTRVTDTAPGTSVPMQILRAGKPQTVSVKVAELDIDAEAAANTPEDVPAPAPRTPRAGPKESTGFGMTIDVITPQLARRAGVPNGRGGAYVASLDPTGAAARSGLNRGDVILAVNNTEVSSVDETAKLLDGVPSGRSAFILVWQQGQGEILVTVRKK
jgi:serine protease Do